MFQDAHAIAKTSASCARPSARRALSVRRASKEPTPLPSPIPIKNTARMIEKVYVVWLKSSPKSRVQIPLRREHSSLTARWRDR